MDHLTAHGAARTGDREDPLAAFRRDLDRFLAASITADRLERWKRQGHVDRTVWTEFAQAGFLGVSLSPAYGGRGGDFRHEVAIIEGLVRHRATGFAVPLHGAVVAPYIARYAREEKRRDWLTSAVSGDTVLAVAMTEPSAGSDLQGIRTSAVRDGRGYRISGQKTFISNGLVADLVLVACKTDRDAGARGISLIAVETSRAGFARGRLLDKLGQHARDTTELFFRDVWVPQENLLGEEGGGFAMLMENLPQERMVIAWQALAMMEEALRLTLDDAGRHSADDRESEARLRLAECRTQTTVARVFLEHCTGLLLAGQLDTTTASMAKYWVSEAQARVMDACLGVLETGGTAGGHPVAEMYRDARAFRLYGGTTEIMKTIIARSLGDRLIT